MVLALSTREERIPSNDLNLICRLIGCSSSQKWFCCPFK